MPGVGLAKASFTVAVTQCCASTADNDGTQDAGENERPLDRHHGGRLQRRRDAREHLRDRDCRRRGSFDFRIDVDDNGEPGRSDTYRIRLSNGYDSGIQTLAKGGNIQIH
jgi:hypothetical protein